MELQSWSGLTHVIIMLLEPIDSNLGARFSEGSSVGPLDGLEDTERELLRSFEDEKQNAFSAPKRVQLAERIAEFEHAQDRTLDTEQRQAKIEALRETLG